MLAVETNVQNFSKFQLMYANKANSAFHLSGSINEQ